MNDLIKIEERDGIQTVDARDLWQAVESKREFAHWIKDRLEGFIVGTDYTTIDNFVKREGSNLGNKQTDYYLTLEMAKHIAMLERNEKGKEIRQYFIDVDRAWNTPEMIMIRAQKAAEIIIARQKEQIKQLTPKAEFFDQVANSKDAIPMRQVAAVLNMPGWGRNKIYQFLRENKILDNDNLPYREYQDRGYFRVIERAWGDSNGERHIAYSTLVYQRGLDFIRKQIAKLSLETFKSSGKPALTLSGANA